MAVLLLSLVDLVLDHDDYPMARERVQTSTCMFAFENFLTKIATVRFGDRPGCAMTDFSVPPRRGFVTTASLHSLLLLEACVTLSCAIMADNWETKAIPKPSARGVGSEMEDGQ